MKNVKINVWVIPKIDLVGSTIKGDGIGLHWSIPTQFKGWYIELIEDKICVDLDNKQGWEEENYKDHTQSFHECQGQAWLQLWSLVGTKWPNNL